MSSATATTVSNEACAAEEGKRTRSRNDGSGTIERRCERRGRSRREAETERHADRVAEGRRADAAETLRTEVGRTRGRALHHERVVEQGVDHRTTGLCRPERRSRSDGLQHAWATTGDQGARDATVEGERTWLGSANIGWQRHRDQVGHGVACSTGRRLGDGVA